MRTRINNWAQDVRAGEIRVRASRGSKKGRIQSRNKQNLNTEGARYEVRDPFHEYLGHSHLSFSS